MKLDPTSYSSAKRDSTSRLHLRHLHHRCLPYLRRPPTMFRVRRFCALVPEGRCSSLWSTARRRRLGSSCIARQTVRTRIERRIVDATLPLLRSQRVGAFGADPTAAPVWVVELTASSLLPPLALSALHKPTLFSSPSLTPHPSDIMPTRRRSAADSSSCSIEYRLVQCVLCSLYAHFLPFP